MNPYRWPSNPDSPEVDASVNWAEVNFDALRNITPRMVRKIPLPLLGQLHSKYEQLWALMPIDCQDLGMALLEGRPSVKKEGSKTATTKTKDKSDKDRLLDAITDIEEIAADDPSVLLKAVECIQRFAMFLMKQ